MERHAARMQWYTRRDGVIRGPFSSAEMTRNLVLGRIHIGDEVSQDKCNWKSAEQCKLLLPPELRQISSWDDYQRFVMLRSQLDERKGERRVQSSKFHLQRRSGKDRRHPENDLLINRNLLGKIRKKTNLNIPHENLRPVLLALLMLSIIVVWLVPTQR